MFRKKVRGTANDVWNHKNPLPNYTPMPCQSNPRPPLSIQIFPEHDHRPFTDTPVDSNEKAQQPIIIESSDEEDDFITRKALTTTTSSRVPPATDARNEIKRKRKKSKKDYRRYLLARKNTLDHSNSSSTSSFNSSFNSVTIDISDDEEEEDIDFDAWRKEEIERIKLKRLRRETLRLSNIIVISDDEE